MTAYLHNDRTSTESVSQISNKIVYEIFYDVMAYICTMDEHCVFYEKQLFHNDNIFIFIIL